MWCKRRYCSDEIGGVEANSCLRLHRIKSKMKNIFDTFGCVRVLGKRDVARSIVFAVNEFKPLTRGDGRGAIRNRDFFTPKSSVFSVCTTLHNLQTFSDQPRLVGSCFDAHSKRRRCQQTAKYAHVTHSVSVPRRSKRTFS